MQSAYIENKDFKDLFVRFSVSFGSQHLDVFVWRNVRGLHRNTYFYGGDYLGAYVFYPRRKKRGLFGEVHLVKRMIGAGYVAHELEHFIYDWLIDRISRSKTGYVDTVEIMNEPTARLMGDVTRDFWFEWLKIEKKNRNGKNA
jgi:hypothetical protein